MVSSERPISGKLAAPTAQELLSESDALPSRRIDAVPGTPLVCRRIRQVNHQGTQARVGCCPQRVGQVRGGGQIQLTAEAHHDGTGCVIHRIVQNVNSAGEHARTGDRVARGAKRVSRHQLSLSHHVPYMQHLDSAAVRQQRRDVYDGLKAHPLAAQIFARPREGRQRRPHLRVRGSSASEVATLTGLSVKYHGCGC